MDSLEFVPSTFPFADFLLASGEYGAAPVSLPGLRPRGPQPTSPLFYVPSEAPEFKDGLVFGVWHKGGSLRAGITPLDRSLLDPFGRLDAVGQYVCIVAAPSALGERVVVSSDEFGLVPLFYYRDSAGALVSNRIHLIVEMLRAHGVAIKINYPALYSRCFVDKTICVQATTLETIYDGILMTLPWQRLEVSPNGVFVSGEEPEYEELSVAEYNDLILAGAGEIKHSILSAINSDSFPRVVSTLTGGRDSRAMFAALTALDQVGSVPFQTQPIDDEDVNVATALVREFGGQFDTVPAGIGSASTPSAHFTSHRSIFMGQYSDLKKTPVSVPSPALRMVGGCGEVYRSFYTGQYAEGLMYRAFDRESVRDFLRCHTFWKLYSPEVFELVEEIVFRSMRSLRGTSFSAKMEDHYFCFRNRLHFGMAGTHRHPDAPVYQPLISPSLLRAARGLPHDVRLSGRAIYDVTAALSPEVAHFPYAGKPLVDFSKVPYHVDRTRGLRHVAYEPDPEMLAAAGRVRAALAPPREKGATRQGPSPLGPTIDGFLPSLRELDGFSQLLSDELISRLEWLKQRRSKFYRVWASRISAMGDAATYAKLI